MSHLKESIVILGCHRSGTSALSAVLASCGYQLPGGDVDTGRHENPEGYYENRVVVHANNRVLRVLGHRWDDPVELDQQIDSDLAAYFRQDVFQIVQTYFSGSGFVVKDPRMSTLWPLWLAPLQSLGSGSLTLLIAVRNPTRVAESLIRRHRREPKNCRIATLDQGYVFWTAQTLSALRAAMCENFMIIDSDAFVKDPLGLMFEMKSRLGLSVTNAGIGTGVETFEREIRRNDLYVAADDDGDAVPRSEWYTRAMTLYRSLLSVDTHEKLFEIVRTASNMNGAARVAND